ncbi:hypothetical protein DFR58_10161 [Anaerobacterium chartisolvens]|uniref:Uncharacterized protein n=1 Tax=Anaerobacterium chartisolvens TaxID=1297424 RepID=A0A369BH29_9FIRM|nr:hypothetical protein DFR58_10161 [Anaerobacterium chartisolvens]
MNMDMREFSQTWETEYIKSRVDRVSESLKNGRYEQALDYLRMIQDKSKAAEILIKNSLRR